MTSHPADTEDVDTTPADTADTTTETTTSATTKPESTKPKSRRKRIGSATVSITQVGVALLIVALIAVAAVSTWLAVTARSDLDADRALDGDYRRAEQLALDYAVGAAEMNFEDTAGWRTRLTANTLPDVANKLTNAAGSIEQIIVPLQWKSTATPLAAKVRDVTDGVLTVDTFVNVETKNMQAPDGMQTTATYVVKIDPHRDWKIADVGGIRAIAPK